MNYVILECVNPTMLNVLVDYSILSPSMVGEVHKTLTNGMNSDIANVILDNLNLFDFLKISTEKSLLALAEDAVAVRNDVKWFSILRDVQINRVSQYYKHTYDKHMPMNRSIRADNVSMLMEVAREGRVALMNYMFRNGYVIYKELLETAIEYNHFELVKYLVEVKYLRNDNECMYAARFGRLDILKYFIKRECNCEQIKAEASKNGHLDILIWAFNARIEPKYTNSYIWFNAIRYGHIHLLEWLHKNNYTPATIDINCANTETRKWLIAYDY